MSLATNCSTMEEMMAGANTESYLQVGKANGQVCGTAAQDARCRLDR